MCTKCHKKIVIYTEKDTYRMYKILQKTKKK